MPSDHPVAAAYLELLKLSLTDALHPPRYAPLQPAAGGWAQAMKRAAAPVVNGMLRPWRLELVRQVEFETTPPFAESSYPVRAESMIGRKSLDQLQASIEAVLQQRIPGDFIECGVWRGGATIFMRAMLNVYGDRLRRVWVADSFRGLPPPDPASYPADSGSVFHRNSQLAIGLDEVKANFERYGLLDDQVCFLPGWFKDSLPAAPISRLAILRLDGDMYESTIQALNFLYPKLSAGGFCIVDDYGAVPACREATDDYRRLHGITEPPQWVNETCVFWQRG